MFVKLGSHFLNKEDLMTAIVAGEYIVARDSKTDDILLDGNDIIISIMGYPGYHSWTARITVKNGRIISVR